MENILFLEDFQDLSTTAVPSTNAASSFLSEKQNGSSSWRSLFAFTNRRNIAVLTAATALSVSSGLVLPGMAVLMGRIFGTFAGVSSGEISPYEFMENIKRLILQLVALGCISWLLNGAFFACWLWFGEQQAKAAREELFDGLMDKEAEHVFCQQDPRGQDLYWIGPPGEKFDVAEDTDFAAVEQGYVSITPLQVDLTAYGAQDVVENWLASMAD